MPGRPRRVAGAGSRRPEPAPLVPEREPAPVVAERAVVPVVAELIVVGRIGRPQGIKGELTVEVRTDDPEDRFAPGRVLQTEPEDRGPLTVITSRMQGKYLVVRFDGPTDRNDAEQLRDTILKISTADLPPLAEQDEYYDTQLIGLVALLSDGAELGKISDVLHLPGGDVLVVQRPHGAEALIPFVKAIVPTVDLATGTALIDPPEGLLELSDPTAEQPADAMDVDDPTERP